MKILYYDCFAGVSGDMNLGAMLDLGVDADALRRELSKLSIDNEFSLRVERDARKGICGTRVDVLPVNGQHDPAATTGHTHGEQGRTLTEVEGLIKTSPLSEAVKGTSLAIFHRLAEAESRVQDRPVQEVQFHEAGGTDCLVDIVGAAICRSLLDVDEIWASPLELGGGFSHCRVHGRRPVPAPTTLDILEGIPTTRGAVQKEQTTPTGAAIMAELVDRFTDTPGMIMERTAYGIGQRDTEIPNVLRVIQARPLGVRNGQEISEACILQCNIDDMTPEMLGVAMERLMDAGAMDVHFTPIQMKKNRPATSLSLLCARRDQSRFKDLIFKHTSTLGIKSIPLEKTALEIKFRTQQTPLGPVRMKQAMFNDRVLREKPELEDCRAMAAKNDMSLSEIYAIIANSHKK